MAIEFRITGINIPQGHHEPLFWSSKLSTKIANTLDPMKDINCVHPFGV